MTHTSSLFCIADGVKDPRCRTPVEFLLQLLETRAVLREEHAGRRIVSGRPDGMPWTWTVLAADGRAVASETTRFIANGWEVPRSESDEVPTLTSLLSAQVLLSGALHSPQQQLIRSSSGSAENLIIVCLFALYSYRYASWHEQEARE